MKRTMWILLGIFAATVLAACSQTRQFQTTGSMRILATQPGDPNGCPLAQGQWFLITGEDFGNVAQWASEVNTVTFAPGDVPAKQVELTQVTSPATLMIQVPEGARSGSMVVSVHGVGTATFQISIAAAGNQGLSPTMAVPSCTDYPAAPAQPD